MLRSMTGFGAAQASIEGVEYAVEIRSVNSRYIKLTTRLPEIWSAAEAEIEALLRKSISRGAVTLKVRMRIPDDKAAHRVNSVALQNYVNQLQMLPIRDDPTTRVDLASLLQLPGVCEPPPLDDLCEATRDGLMALIGQTLDQLIDMRCKEGQAVTADLLAQCKVIEQNMAAIEPRAGDVIKEYHQRLTARVAELVEAQRITIDAESLAREVAIYADRCDIAEEISRLKGHLDQFRAATELTEPAGRKLDFIAQEMLREGNTIGSKANDLEIAQAVVEIKTAIDRIKEQAANVE